MTHNCPRCSTPIPEFAARWTNLGTKFSFIHICPSSIKPAANDVVFTEGE